MVMTVTSPTWAPQEIGVYKLAPGVEGKEEEVVRQPLASRPPRPITVVTPVLPAPTQPSTTVQLATTTTPARRLSRSTHGWES